jgi:glycosyltransferase involved in cell wall biosynthesis
VNVMQVVPSIAFGGAELMAVDLARGLRDRGLSVSLVSLYDCPPGPLRARIDTDLRGVEYESLGKIVGFDPGAVQRLRDAMRRHGVDVVHSHQHALRYVLAASLVGSKRCHVHTLHTPEPAQRTVVNNMLHRLSRLAGVKTVAVAPIVAASYTEAGRYGELPVVPNGVDTNRFRPDRAAGAAWRDEMGLPDSAVVFVCVARFHPLKNHEALIRAFAAVAAARPELSLVLAGDGLTRGEAEITAGSLGLEDRVRFLGATTRVTEVLAGSDVFVLASRWEGNPISILEAMAAGLPIVAPEVGGIGGVVRPAVDGHLFGAGDDHGFRVALAALADSQEMRRTMGLAARERVLTSFSLEAMVDGYLAVYGAPVRPDSR